MSLATLLGITPRDPEPYRPGSEPTAARKPPSRRRTADLTRWAAHIAAGVPDAVVAAEAGVSASAVRSWRLRRGFRRPRSVQERVDALAVALPAFRDVAMPTHSPVDGDWTPPRYVLRVALNYTAFCAAVCALVDAGWEAEVVAAALGVRGVDAVHAEALGRARL